jgi:UDPglucose 6-dehydrogenase
MTSDSKFTVVGAGYVGLSLAALISSRYDVSLVEIIKDKVDMINRRKSPISDKEIEEALVKNTRLFATDDISVVRDSEFVIVATPTDYDTDTGMFDTRKVETVIDDVRSVNPDCVIVIKSTIPIGYVEGIYSKGIKNVLFSPEFLREGRALYDNLHPSRIIVGVPFNDEYLRNKASVFAEILKECSLDDDTKTLIIGSTEAESVKLFSNSYLAMRVSFFNELDSFAEDHDLISGEIIKGVCMDPRIGDHYNNPSFGYGGYCLPKDSKQLLSNFCNTPNSIIGAIVKSNEIRKETVSERIIKKAGSSGTVGIYQLAMKSGSDNFRESSVIDVIDILRKSVKVVIFEPQLAEDEFHGCPVVKDLDKFKSISDIIVVNRTDDNLKGVSHKVYTRDVFTRD